MLAVVLTSSMMRWGSPSPGTWTRTRASPWRAMVGSVRPVSSIRRRMTSIDCVTVRVWISASASGVIVMRMVRSASSRVNDTVCAPKPPPCPGTEALPTGWARSWTRSQAASIWSSRAICTTTSSPMTVGRRVLMTGSRRRITLASSARFSSRRSFTSCRSTSKTRCAPPRRSRPRLTLLRGRYRQTPRASSVISPLRVSKRCSAGTRFGIENSTPRRTTPRMTRTFQGEKYSMTAPAPDQSSETVELLALRRGFGAGLSVSLAGLGAVRPRTSAMVDLTTWT